MAAVSRSPTETKFAKISVDSGHDWAPFVLVEVVALFMVLVFIYFFQKFLNFVVRFAVWV